MTIQDLLRKVDTENFIKRYLNINLGFVYEEIDDIENITMLDIQKINRYIQKIKETLEYFRNAEIEKNDKYVVFVIPSVSDNSVLYDSFLIKKKDILTSNQEYDRYGYELSDYNEVLGYRVSETTLYNLGEVLTAVTIFDEMTFCGLDVTGRNEQVEEITNEIEESIKEIESEQNDENSSKFISLDQLLKDINYTDKRKPYEKTFEDKKTHIESAYLREYYDFMFKQEKIFIERK